ncbi:hypothetical protein ACFY30_29890 [Streptomyces sp. NPDC000345]|uniref:hypothetical protein n=1 Tax=Streptomyces sp. NPDC000345 TaxID=3364537 RepID=UPI0036C379BA
MTDIYRPATKQAKKLKAGDHLKLRNGKTVEILAIEPAINQKGDKCLILSLYRMPKMVVKAYRVMNMHYPS